MWNIFRTLAIFIVMFLIIINEIYCDDDFSSFANGKTITGEKILSRKRRYLIFPEGSSVQLGMFYLFFLNYVMCKSVSYNLCI